MEYTDLRVASPGSDGHIVEVIHSGRVAARLRHRPWFIAVGDRRPEGVEAEPLEATPLLWDQALFAYAPSRRRVWRVYASSATEVPRLAKMLEKRGYKVGLHNVKYLVRVSLDLLEQGYKLLGEPAPAVLLPNSEMQAVMEDVLERVQNLRVLVFDIEVLSRRGGFPKRGDPVAVIAWTTFTLGEDIRDQNWPRENIVVEYAEGTSPAEVRRLVEGFLDTVAKLQPDLVATYNGSGFDIPYLEPHVTLPDAIVERFHLGLGEVRVPHIDLFVARESMGSALGVRSHAAHALDEVALEVASQVPGLEWLKTSKLMEAERLLNPAKLREYFERRDQLLEEYVRADIYLTAILARYWLYPIFMLSVLTGAPPSILHQLNVGQLAEYIEVELYRRLRLLPELHERRFDYGRAKCLAVEGWDTWVFTRGKVYARSPGLHGGGDKYVVELDFDMLYPTDMVAHAADPTAVYIVDGLELATGRRVTPTLVSTPARWARERTADILLGEGDPKKNKFKPTMLLRVVHGYGPTSWLVYKLWTARRETKRLKKRAKREGRPELAAPDQAVKILVNSFYGAHSKRRGNLVNEAMAAGVFWRTQKLLYEVIEFIDKELPKHLGLKPGDVYVAYGDTDSAYIVAPRSVPPERIAEEVNKWVKRRYGEYYNMSLEDVYDSIIIPRQLSSTEPSAKSYICLRGGEIVKIKGEFFKLQAPAAIKERLTEFYQRVLRCRSKECVERVVGEILEGSPTYAWFIKKSVSSLVSDDDPAGVKRVNRDFHYAALYQLYMERSEGVTVLDVRSGSRGWVWLRLRIDPREAWEGRHSVVVYYLPHPSGDPRRVLVYESGEDPVTVHQVVVDKVSVEGDPEVYVVELKARVVNFTREELRPLVVMAVRKYVVNPVWGKLVSLFVQKTLS